MNLTLGILLLVVGAALGFMVAKMTAKKSATDEQTLAKNEQLEAEIAQYKRDVEQHFASSADLLNNMAQEYSKVYQHMAQAQQSLLPDSELTITIPFKDNKESALISEVIEDVEIQALAANDTQETMTEQPNDYVLGSHGIITPPQDLNNDTPKSA